MSRQCRDLSAVLLGISISKGVTTPVKEKDSSELREDYIVDVASERVYVNQDKAYHEAFTKWRNNKKNRYGYRFVHDTREHTYVDGEGYADRRSENEERSSLRYCFAFLGTSMLMLFLFNQIQFMLMRMLFGVKTVEWTYVSELDSAAPITLNEVLVSCGFKIFTLLVILLLYVFFIHLPLNVSFPSSKLSPKFFLYAFNASLIMAVILHLFDRVVTATATDLGIDISYYALPVTDSASCFVVSVLCNMLVIPIMSELLFRGCILQLFRQYGDRFAILVASFASACCYHDITKFLYVFCWSVILSIITIKSGSIIPALVIKITGDSLIIMLNTLLTNEKTVYADLLESVICLSVIIVCISLMFIMRIKMMRPFKIEPDRTALPLSQKLREVLNSPWSVIWLTVTLLTTILTLEVK